MLLLAYSSPVKAQTSNEISETWLKVRTNLVQFYVIIYNDFLQPHLLWNNDSRCKFWRAWGNIGMERDQWLQLILRIWGKQN